MRGTRAGSTDPRRRPTVAIPLACLVLVSGCGGGQRPSSADWRPTWDATVALVPGADEMGPAPDGDGCQDVLVDLRKAQDGLLPGPDEVIDRAAEQWVQAAESAFFECFGDGDRAAAVKELYRTLDELEAEVDAALGAQD